MKKNILIAALFALAATAPESAQSSTLKMYQCTLTTPTGLFVEGTRDDLNGNCLPQPGPLHPVRGKGVVASNVTLRTAQFSAVEACSSHYFMETDGCADNGSAGFFDNCYRYWKEHPKAMACQAFKKKAECRVQSGYYCSMLQPAGTWGWSDRNSSGAQIFTAQDASYLWARDVTLPSARVSLVEYCANYNPSTGLHSKGATIYAQNSILNGYDGCSDFVQKNAKNLACERVSYEDCSQ